MLKVFEFYLIIGNFRLYLSVFYKDIVENDVSNVKHNIEMSHVPCAAKMKHLQPAGDMRQKINYVWPVSGT